jgi:hypothetical protein
LLGERSLAEQLLLADGRQRRWGRRVHMASECNHGRVLSGSCPEFVLICRTNRGTLLT